MKFLSFVVALLVALAFAGTSQAQRHVRRGPVLGHGYYHPHAQSLGRDIYRGLDAGGTCGGPVTVDPTASALPYQPSLAPSSGSCGASAQMSYSYSRSFDPGYAPAPVQSGCGARQYQLQRSIRQQEILLDSYGSRLDRLHGARFPLLRGAARVATFPLRAALGFPGRHWRR